jgi:hypothetical protein
MRPKPFGYPIALEHLDLFKDPDGNTPPVEWKGHTYYQTDWWTLRTHQATPAMISPTEPVSSLMMAAMDLAEAKADSLPEHLWKPLDDIAPLVNKYTARIWERTHLRHHLQSYPLVMIAHHYAQRGILQLCTRLPRAEVFTGTHLTHLTIRFRSGSIILHPLPDHITRTGATLHFFQPKHSKI